MKNFRQINKIFGLPSDISPMGTYITYEKRINLCTKVELLFRKSNPDSLVFTDAFRIRYSSNYFGIICMVETLYLESEDDDLTKRLNKDVDRFIGYLRNYSIVILKMQSSLLRVSIEQTQNVVNPVSIVTRFSSGLCHIDGFSKDYSDILRPKAVYKNLLEFELDDFPFTREVFDVLTALHH